MKRRIPEYIFTLCLIWAPAGFADVDLFVSVLPLKYFAERVGGKYVEVEVMVQPGHSPVTYEPTPRQMAALSIADAYVRVGVPFESFWMQYILKANPDLEIIDVRKGIKLSPPGNTSLYLADHVGRDPHIWLDPALAGQIAHSIRDYLIRVDGVNSQYYRSHTEELLTEFEQLDADIRKLFANLKSRKFLVFHPAWGYFAKAYGLEQIAVEYEGKEPGPRSLSTLLDLARREGIHTVFAQKQFSSKMVNTLATEINGRVIVLDPLAEDYFGSLIEAARAISGAGEP